MIASVALKQMQEMHDEQSRSLLAKCKTEPLDTVRFEAGKLEGLQLAIRILEESNGKEASK